MASLNFDATNIAPNSSFDPMPDGWYQSTIVEAEMVPTKDGSTEMLKLTHEIDGNAHAQYAGRKVFDRLSIHHANQQPREIAQRNLSAICHAIGRLQVADTSELLGARLLIKLKAVPSDGQYDARNEVRGYKGAGSSAPPAAAPKMSAPAAPAAAAAKPSWKRG
jgi:hypothetical protein